MEVEAIAKFSPSKLHTLIVGLVALATMEHIAQRYGPAPKAFLLLTLAGPFFAVLANAFVIKGFLALPFMH